MSRLMRRWLPLVIPAGLVVAFVVVRNSPGTEPFGQVQQTVAQSAPLSVPAPAVDGVPAPAMMPVDQLPYSQRAKYVGAAGCAAANCHGGDALTQVQGSEHSIWIQKDPHVNAYNVLYNKTSRRIMSYLKQSPRYAYLKGQQAWEAKICLDCHATAPSKDRLVEGHKFSLADGVGCESCHGPAEKWLDPHKRESWKYLSTEEKTALGYIDTDNILERSRMCASCHVGAVDREVNHDIMAGGHPRLNFEMSAYHSILPAHWNRNQDRRRHATTDSPVAADVRSTFQAKLWAVGQLTAAEKSLELLQERATNPQRVWPEFTEYGCYACHHNLQPDFSKTVDDETGSWRQQRGYPFRKPGHYPYGTWQFAMLPGLMPANADAFKPDGPFAKLSGEMGKPVPNREKVAQQAASLKQEIANLAKSYAEDPLTEEQTRQLLAAYLQSTTDRPIESWDTAAQSYLALVALYQGLVDVRGRAMSPSQEDREIFEQFGRARSALKFPRNYDSPKTFEEEALQRTKLLKDLLKQLQSDLKTTP